MTSSEQRSENVPLPFLQSGEYVVHTLAGEALNLKPFPGWQAQDAIQQIEDLIGNSRLEYHLVANNRRLDDHTICLDTEDYPSGSLQVVMVERRGKKPWNLCKCIDGNAVIVDLTIWKDIWDLLHESDDPNVAIYHSQLVKKGYPREKVMAKTAGVYRRGGRRRHRESD